jgi:heterodisulfide reductase subunit B
VEAATRYTLKKLGVDAAPLQEMACCMDPVVLKSLSHDAWLTVAARNLGVAAEQGCDAILTLCNGCFCSLNEAAHMLDEDHVLRAKVNETLASIDRSYEGGMKVTHLAKLLEDMPEETIAKNVARPLEGRKVAAFHGCHLVRPAKYAEVDDPVRPRLIDRMVERLGGESVDYWGRNECCGIGFLPTGDKVGAERLEPILEAMERAGAEWIVTPCPTCFQQLETAQRMAKGLTRPLPVLHIAELFAIALGQTEEKLGLKHHRVKMTEPLAAPS